MQPAEPDQRHAIRGYQPSTIVNSPERLIPLTLHDPMHPGDADVVLLSFSNPALDRLERLSHVDGAHPDAEDVDSLDAPPRSGRFREAGGVDYTAMRRLPRPYLATYWS